MPVGAFRDDGDSRTGKKRKKPTRAGVKVRQKTQVVVVDVGICFTGMTMVERKEQKDDGLEQEREGLSCTMHDTKTNNNTHDRRGSSWRILGSNTQVSTLTPQWKRTALDLLPECLPYCLALLPYCPLPFIIREKP